MKKAFWLVGLGAVIVAGTAIAKITKVNDYKGINVTSDSSFSCSSLGTGYYETMPSGTTCQSTRSHGVNCYYDCTCGASYSYSSQAACTATGGQVTGTCTAGGATKYACGCPSGYKTCSEGAGVGETCTANGETKYSACANTTTCQNYMLVYSDGNCYENEAAPEGVTPVAVVVDAANGVAVSLDETTSVAWQQGGESLNEVLAGNPFEENSDLIADTYNEDQSQSDVGITLGWLKDVLKLFDVSVVESAYAVANYTCPGYTYCCCGIGSNVPCVTAGLSTDCSGGSGRERLIGDEELKEKASPDFPDIPDCGACANITNCTYGCKSPCYVWGGMDCEANWSKCNKCYDSWADWCKTKGYSNTVTSCPNGTLEPCEKDSSYKKCVCSGKICASNTQYCSTSTYTCNNKAYCPGTCKTKCGSNAVSCGSQETCSKQCLTSDGSSAKCVSSNYCTCPTGKTKLSDCASDENCKGGSYTCQGETYCNNGCKKRETCNANCSGYNKTSCASDEQQIGGSCSCYDGNGTLIQKKKCLTKCSTLTGFVANASNCPYGYDSTSTCANNGTETTYYHCKENTCTYTNVCSGNMVCPAGAATCESGNQTKCSQPCQCQLTGCSALANDERDGHVRDEDRGGGGKAPKWTRPINRKDRVTSQTWDCALDSQVCSCASCTKVNQQDVITEGEEEPGDPVCKKDGKNYCVKGLLLKKVGYDVTAVSSKKSKTKPSLLNMIALASFAKETSRGGGGVKMSGKNVPSISFPAADVCGAKGNNWLLPTAGDLQKISKIDLNKLNQIAKKYGKPLDANTKLWSSTQACRKVDDDTVVCDSAYQMQLGKDAPEAGKRAGSANVRCIFMLN